MRKTAPVIWTSTSVLKYKTESVYGFCYNQRKAFIVLADLMKMTMERINEDQNRRV